MVDSVIDSNALVEKIDFSSFEDKLIKIIKKCNARGGTDNISIAYLVKDGDNL